MLRGLRRPEYLWRPRQIWRRLRRPWGLHLPAWSEVEMPWGWPMRIRTHETIGRLIWTFGVFDLPVTEVLWRLTERGETVVDAGANIGCMSCVLAARVGGEGEVLAFEPFPEVQDELRENLARWRARRPGVSVRVHACALGAGPGRGRLSPPEEKELNRGLARVEGEGTAEVAGAVAVEIETLDRVVGLGGRARVGVLKIDVEGGELGVLQGGEGLLRAGRIRDIVFEDHGEYPTPSTSYLEGMGYRVYTLRHRLRGLVVRPAGQPTLPQDPMESPSHLATLDPERLERRLGGWGWLSLRGRADR